ncbi:restriction endonuclease [Schleiferilactobacillus harbinensis]|uniref:restriction endonuclease n=1 Tax=Schleiferilactobacillus harbinensis TaxID=304207 RepID=UPI001AAF7866|nr:restriction endonuclease [Schleiferilactobacillus harbinensis]
MYLLHRIYNQTSAAMQIRLLEEENKLSIGYAAFVLAGEGDTLIGHARTMAKADFAVYFAALGHKMGLPWATRTRSHWLYYFLQLESNDTVVVPTHTGFAIYRVTAAPEVVPTVAREHDVGFTVPVKLLVNDPKGAVGAALTDAMRFRGTDLMLSGQATQDIDGLVAGQDTTVPEPAAAAVAAVQETLQGLHPAQFTEIVGRYLRAMGADEVRYPAADPNKDETPVDILGVFRNVGAVILVHAQQYSGTVPEAGIQELVGFQYTTFEGYDAMAAIKWFVTTGHFPEDEDEAVGYVQENRVQVLQDKDLAKRLVISGVDLSFAKA